MAQRVIVHRYEETARGTPRIVESGAFDPDAEDNPDWVTEALAAREEPEEESVRLTPWDSERDVAPQPLAVFDSIEFGEDTSLPDVADEVSVADEEVIVDPDPQPKATLESTEFGQEVEPPARSESTGLPREAAEVPGDADANGEAPVESDEPDPQADRPDSEEPGDLSVEAPPRRGAGSGREAWADYADTQDVEVTPEMSRDDIIAACERRGVATE
jgi:hypothetical protein